MSFTCWQSKNSLWDEGNFEFQLVILVRIFYFVNQRNVLGLANISAHRTVLLLVLFCPVVFGQRENQIDTSDWKKGYCFFWTNIIRLVLRLTKLSKKSSSHYFTVSLILQQKLLPLAVLLLFHTPSQHLGVQPAGQYCILRTLKTRTISVQRATTSERCVN